MQTYHHYEPNRGCSALPLDPALARLVALLDDFDQRSPAQELKHPIHDLGALQLTDSSRRRSVAPVLENCPYGRTLPHATEDDVRTELGWHFLNDHPGIYVARFLLNRYCLSDVRDNGMSYLEQHNYPMVIDYLRYCETRKEAVDPDDVVFFKLHDLLEKYIRTPDDRRVLTDAIAGALDSKMATLLDLASKPTAVELEAYKSEHNDLNMTKMGLYVKRMRESEYEGLLFFLKAVDRINNLRCSIANANLHFNGNFKKLEQQMTETRKYLFEGILRHHPDTWFRELDNVLTAGDDLLKAAVVKKLYTLSSAAA